MMTKTVGRVAFPPYNPWSKVVRARYSFSSWFYYKAHRVISPIWKALGSCFGVSGHPSTFWYNQVGAPQPRHT